MRRENIDIFGGPQHGQITISKRYEHYYKVALLAEFIIQGNDTTTAINIT